MIKVAQGVLGDDELAAVREAFAYGYFGMASRVAAFEQALEEYLGAPNVVAVNSGTSAIHLALDAVGVGEGDEVVVPSLTFVACFQAIKATGATPVPCDVRPDTLQLDLDDVERRLTPRTRAILPMHYGGSPCDVDRVLELASRHGLRVVEDAAHAFGSTSLGRRIGGFGDVACFSFDSIKTITCGEGGAVACRDDETAELMRRKRILGVVRRGHAGSATSRGERWRFEVDTRGFRYHLSDINAAIGLVQLTKVDEFIARRREICRRYDAAFADLDGVRPLPVDYDDTAPHIYVVRVGGGRRDDLIAHLSAQEIETAVNYIPNHLHPFFRQDGLRLPETERAYDEILTLPLHCSLSDADVARVIEQVRAFAAAAAPARDGAR
jgi:dTDP-4-amino-4,6-dideoxygalactose transaminase